MHEGIELARDDRTALLFTRFIDAEGLPAPDVLNRRVASDIASLVALQNGDGGFGIWRLREKSWPYHSAHAAHALVEARANGYDVPDSAITSALGYLSLVLIVLTWLPQLDPFGHTAAQQRQQALPSRHFIGQ